MINPAKPGEAVNVKAAQEFVGVLTSLTLQSQVSRYLTEPRGRTVHGDRLAFRSASPSDPSVDTGGMNVTVGLLNAEPRSRS